VSQEPVTDDRHVVVPGTVYDRVPEAGITSGCTSIVSSLSNVMAKAGDNHR